MVECAFSVRWRRVPGARMDAAVEVRIASDPRWLRFVRLVIREFCQALSAGEEVADAVVVAVNEAVSNVMRHAYGGDTTQPISIRCSRHGDMLEVSICDHGKEADLVSQPIQPPNELRSGGRGLFLIRSLVDEYEFVRADGRNRLDLRKRLPQPLGAPREG